MGQWLSLSLLAGYWYVKAHVLFSLCLHDDNSWVGLLGALHAGTTYKQSDHPKQQYILIDQTSIRETALAKDTYFMYYFTDRAKQTVQGISPSKQKVGLADGETGGNFLYTKLVPLNEYNLPTVREHPSPLELGRK